MGDALDKPESAVQVIRFFEPVVSPAGPTRAAAKPKNAPQPALDADFKKILLRFPLFDVDFYASNFADTNFKLVNPVEHYFSTPLDARRSPHPLFDRSYYRTNRPDLPADRDEFLDYLALGDRGGHAPHILFDPVYYRHSNPDLQGADDLTLWHFITRGHREGRNPHPLFATAWYLSQYPEAAEAPNALIHYLSTGIKKGYAPHPLFDPAWYLSQTDSAEARANPLTHYLTVGSAAGLSPHPLFDPIWYVRTQVDPGQKIKEFCRTF